MYCDLKYNRSVKRENQLLIRLSESEKRGFQRAAEISGINTSEWARERLRAAAIRDLEPVGILAPFLEELLKEEQK